MAEITIMHFVYIFHVLVFGCIFRFVYVHCWYVDCTYMCNLLVNWIRLYFGFVCQLVFMYVYSNFFVGFVSFFILCAFRVSYGSLTPNEDIVRFRCGGGLAAYPFVDIFLTFVHFFCKKKLFFE